MVGGAGYVWGAVLGAGIVVVLKEILQSYLPLVFHGNAQLETVIFGILLVALLQIAPGGTDAVSLRGAVRWGGGAGR